MLELTALPSLDADRWSPGPSQDVLLVEGGDGDILAPTDCGRAAWPTFSNSARDHLGSWVSAGSMAMTPRIGDDFVTWPSATTTAP